MYKTLQITGATNEQMNQFALMVSDAFDAAPIIKSSTITIQNDIIEIDYEYHDTEFYARETASEVEHQATLKAGKALGLITKFISSGDSRPIDPVTQPAEYQELLRVNEILDKKVANFIAERDATPTVPLPPMSEPTDMQLLFEELDRLTFDD